LTNVNEDDIIIIRKVDSPILFSIKRGVYKICLLKKDIRLF